MAIIVHGFKIGSEELIFPQLKLEGNFSRQHTITKMDRGQNYLVNKTVLGKEPFTTRSGHSLSSMAHSEKSHSLPGSSAA